ncbi:MAG: amidohydrolase family protein [Rhodospirillaceae bacterium]|jgi:predicted TIM-barrel fold metal-dependent hydrolase|nr:amidohydrolase family protein [Rhodospirillaceae bacterium]
MVRWLGTLVTALLIIAGAQAQSKDRLPLIDAHSQIDTEINRSDIVGLMDKAGIAHVILAARGKVKPWHIAELARQHPTRITASVRTKGGVYFRNSAKYYRLLDVQLGMPEFKAMAELIVWHAQKGTKAREVILPIDSAQVQAAFKAAKDRLWPFIVHIEYKAAGTDGPIFLKSFGELAAANLNMSFVLIHMAQLEADQIERLIKAHPNVYFMTSHANPVVTRKSSQPWTELFDGKYLKPVWTKLMVTHAERFVLAIDNVWQQHWYDNYADQANFWRQALSKLPREAAHAIAHKNAERLWKLSPVN